MNNSKTCQIPEVLYGCESSTIFRCVLVKAEMVLFARYCEYWKKTVQTSPWKVRSIWWKWICSDPHPQNKLVTGNEAKRHRSWAKRETTRTHRGLLGWNITFLANDWLVQQQRNSRTGSRAIRNKHCIRKQFEKIAWLKEDKVPRRDFLKLSTNCCQICSRSDSVQIFEKSYCAQ